jgi:hypothetical protein
MVAEEKTDEGNQERGASSAPSQTILSRKMRKVLDSQLETDFETQEALKELSSFFTENTLKNRRYLRGEIERRSLEINVDFLQSFEKVKNALEDVRKEVVAINQSCTDMKNQLDSTKSRTRDLIAQTASLQEQGNSLERRQKLVHTFLCHYQLSPEQIEALEIRPIGSAFFEALDATAKIHADCKKWVASSGGQQSTALHVMEEMASRQEKAVQRLLKWSIDACRSSCSPAGLTPLDSDLLPLSLANLQKFRPLLVHDVLDEYCQARRTFLTRSFLDALTLGGPGGTPRPIELHAHDPQRYVGDMLAFLHQATPSEKENIYALLKHCEPVLEKLDAKTTKDKSQMCEEALASITEGACRPLRSRVEQILLSEHGPLVLYQLTNLIRFYSTTMTMVIPKGSEFISMLEDLDQMAYTQFMSVLQSFVQSKTSSSGSNVIPSSRDLCPTGATKSLLSLLKDLLNSSTVADEDPKQHEELVNAILDPLLVSLGSSVSAFPTTDQDTYLLNSLYTVHTTLSLFKSNDAKLCQLEGQMNLHLDTMASEQTSSLIANLGLQPICSLIASSHAMPLSKLEGMDSKSLKAFLHKFDSFLVAPDDFMLPQMRLLSSSGHRRAISKRSLQLVAATYKQLFEAVMEARNEYANPESLMSKTPEQVNLLLHL